MHLLQGCGVSLQGEGHVAGDVGYQDNPYSVVDVDAELAGPGEDYAEGDNGAGNGEGQHAEEFQNALATHLHLDDNIGDHDAGKHGDEGSGQTQGYGVEDCVAGYVIFKEDVLIVVQGEVFPGQGQAIGLNAANHEDYHCGQQNGEANISQAEEQQGITQAAQLELHGTEALATDDLVMALAEHLLLSPDDAGCGHDQYGGQYGTGTDGGEGACGFMNLFINQGGDIVDTLFNTQNCHGTEVSHGVEHDEQRTAHDGGQHQRNGDFAGDGEEAGAADTGGFFQSGVHTLQGTANLNKNEGEEVHDLDAADAVVGIDIKEGLSGIKGGHEPLINIARMRTEQHFPSQSADEGGQHEGNEEKALHKGLVGKVGSGYQPSEEGTNDGGAHGGHAGDNQGVDESLEGFGLGEDFIEVHAVEFAVYEEGVEEDQQYGPSYENYQNGDGDEEDDLGNTKATILFDGAASHYSSTSLSCSASNQCKALKVM